jgi:hypothetical protein
MKKFILTLALIATFSVSFTSCSTDDSGLEKTTSADDLSTGNGDVNLPKPTLPRG